MKKLLFLFCLIASTTTYSQPQDKSQRKEKIEALYVAFITRELKITPAEAQKFWPEHSSYDTELKAINTGEKNELTRQQEALNVKKKYESKFSAILGQERTNDFFRKDAEFRKRLLDRVVEGREGGGQHHPKRSNK